MKKKHNWFLNRLKCMSIAEIGFRIRQQIKIRREELFSKSIDKASLPAPKIGPSNNWISFPNTVSNQQLYIDEANKILKGKLKVFQIVIDPFDLILHWNQNPKCGTNAPMSFGKRMDYRNESSVGDIKYLWEPNRHLHLVRLAQAYYLSGNDVYLDALRLHLQSWINQCPYLLGPNWSSSLEVAIRLINWSITWQLIGGTESILFRGGKGQIFLQGVLSTIFKHIDYISKNFSLYSSANNHLIGEAAGIFIGSNTWPYWGKTTEMWRSSSQRILVEEVQKQSHADGGTCEQAISYQQFVLDFLILSLLSGRSHGIVFPSAYLNRIEKMIEFIAAMMDSSGNVPMIGDADDGFVVNMSPEIDFCPYKSVMATGAALFNRQDFLKYGHNIDDKTRWLLGDPQESVTRNSKYISCTKRFFPHSGYYIIGDASQTKEEIRCVIDCGPLGYLSIAAHGHADALAIYLSVSGAEFLIDPGTFCYHTQPRWREYFRGTSAHNTVRIDTTDQSVSGGNFMWIQKYEAHLDIFETTPEVDTFEGQHDGYKLLNDPVIHTRRVVFKKRHNTIYVTDIIKCAQKHLVERFWHFNENCEVAINESTITATNSDVRILMSPGEKSQLALHRGNDELPLGWVSRCYDLKVPGYTAVMTNTIHGVTSLQTEIKLPAR